MWAAGALRGLAGVHHQDLAAGPGQHQSCGQAGGAAADDHDVVLELFMSKAGRRLPHHLATLLFPGKPES